MFKKYIVRLLGKIPGAGPLYHSNAGRRRVAESKRFAWMIESTWSTHLAQKGRQRIGLYENTEISELTKHKLLRNFGLLLIRAHGPFLHIYAAIWEVFKHCHFSVSLAVIFFVIIREKSLLEKHETASQIPQYCNTKQFTHLDIASPFFSLLQRFTVLLYIKSGNVELVDEARLELFAVTMRPYAWKTSHQLLIPCCSKRSKQPIRLVSGLQVKCTTKKPYIPESCGWAWDECKKKWVPVWTT